MPIKKEKAHGMFIVAQICWTIRYVSDRFSWATKPLSYLGGLEEPSGTGSRLCTSWTISLPLPAIPSCCPQACFSWVMTDGPEPLYFDLVVGTGGSRSISGSCPYAVQPERLAHISLNQTWKGPGWRGTGISSFSFLDWPHVILQRRCSSQLVFNGRKRGEPQWPSVQDWLE